MLISSWRKCSRVFWMRAWRSFTASSAMLMAFSLLRAALAVHGGADRLAEDDALHVPARAEVEHDDRQVVVHAEADRRRVHHLQVLLQDVDVRERRELRRGRVLLRVVRVDAVDLRRL